MFKPHLNGSHCWKDMHKTAIEIFNMHSICHTQHILEQARTVHQWTYEYVKRDVLIHFPDGIPLTVT